MFSERAELLILLTVNVLSKIENYSLPPISLPLSKELAIP